MDDVNISIKWDEFDERFMEAKYMAIIQIINNWTIETIDNNNYRGHPMSEALRKQQQKLISYLKDIEIKVQAFDVIAEKSKLSVSDENDMSHKLNSIRHIVETVYKV